MLGQEVDGQVWFGQEVGGMCDYIRWSGTAPPVGSTGWELGCGAGGVGFEGWKKGVMGS